MCWFTEPTLLHLCVQTCSCVSCISVCDGRGWSGRDGCHGSCLRRWRFSYSLMNSITEMGPYIKTKLGAEHQAHLWPQRNNLEAPCFSSACLLSHTRARNCQGFMFGNQGTTGRGGGFSLAAEPRGWTAPQPRLISFFLVQHSLSLWHSALSKGGFFSVTRWHFPSS